MQTSNRGIFPEGMQWQKGIFMQNTFERLQPYDRKRDGMAVVNLWQATVGEQWPLSAARIQHILQTGPEPQHFVVRENGQLVGFVATFVDYRRSNRPGYLALLLVAPEYQRQGIGTLLHTAALDHLRAAGVHSIQLGSLLPRFWCGVPENLPGAVAFFEKNGWEYGQTVYDLVCDISQFTLSPDIQERMRQEQITFAPADQASVTDALVFEAREFPNWLRNHYEPYADLGDQQDFLLARDANGVVVGTLCMYSARSHATRNDVIWKEILGEDAGAIGAVGIAEAERGRGIGLALVAYGTQMLKERGVRNCYIDWVVLTDFYARLGYQIWRSYCTSTHALR